MSRGRAVQWFGDGLPYESIDELPGRLIVIEGTDGVGRSTQIDALSSWVESQGFGVTVTGWTRSPLMGPTIITAKAHTLPVTTFSLLYAADFADRLERTVIPALKAGFVVISDRWVYTALARDAVRGADAQWGRDLFGFALVPDLILYMDVTVDKLMPRILNGKGISYWESGMDLRLADNIYDSCVVYQRRMLQEFVRMSTEYGFHSVNASGTWDRTQRAVRRHVQKLLNEMSAERWEAAAS